MRMSSKGEVKGRCRFRFICYSRDQAAAADAKGTTDVHRRGRLLKFLKKSKKFSLQLKRAKRRLALRFRVSCRWRSFASGASSRRDNSSAAKQCHPLWVGRGDLLPAASLTPDLLLEVRSRLFVPGISPAGAFQPGISHLVPLSVAAAAISLRNESDGLLGSLGVLCELH